MERVEILFDLAMKEFRKNPVRSNRYVDLARKIGTRYQVRFSKELKEKFCKKCSTLMVPGETTKTSRKKGTDFYVVECFRCGHSYRKPAK